MHKSDNSVSVIIPTWNRSVYLERAIGSVLRQTEPAHEILIVDDGSTDDTAQLVHLLASQAHVPVRYLFQENKGPAAARNLGIKNVRGGLIAFLDSDDHWHKEKLARQRSAMSAEPMFAISHTRERWLRRGTHLNQKKKHIPRHGDIFDHCLQLCAVGMSTVMVRQKLFDDVGDFNEKLPCCEDYDLWLRVSARYPFLLVDTPLTVKEGGREDQVSVQYQVGMDRFRIQALVDLLESGVLLPHQSDAARRELCRKANVYGRGCCKHGKIHEGQRYVDLAKQYES
ncbi:MAG: glycosyltransferase family 2 protein [Desulfobulbaceae bacterium]|uniref:Glycosyltransferase family 2 protein n=1 Tax=Candidatus Desulfatifera sulfidica TaxID=2841691 RepID=A0A8J6N8R5_9BACT|nr:glycosyltransferase family 2 protein [Candidatus Desulfatifera sulfidica]